METIKLCETGWSNMDLKPDCKKIHTIVSQINDVIDDMCNEHPKTTNGDLMILFGNIIEVLAKWTGDTYVGQKKDEELKSAFQAFFNSFF